MSGILAISGPSGIGKNFLTYTLRNSYPNTFGRVTLSVVINNCRTRREGEIEGVHYYYPSEREYLEQRASGELFMDNVFFGTYYGIRRDAVEAVLNSSLIPLLEIYSPVMNQVHRGFPNSKGIFLLPEDNRPLAQNL